MKAPAFTSDDIELMAWAEETGEGAERELFGDFALWLIEGTSDDWHNVGLYWNWDFSPAPLRWIIRQPNCELATALEIFHLADPGYYANYGKPPVPPRPVGDAVFDLLDEVRTRAVAGFYTRKEIGCSFGNDFRAEAADYVPQATCVTITGRAAVAEPFGDGMPMRLHKAPYVSKYDRSSDD